VRVLIGCEMSGITRQAFAAAGHLAMSCDLKPSELPGWHYQGDVRDVLGMGWDLAIFHPDCTYLTNAGNRWFYDPDPKYADRRKLQDEAMAFFRELQAAPIPRICIENPQPTQHVMYRVGRYTQKIQPWMFGNPESKGLCLWLKNLPPLMSTEIVSPDQRRQSCWRMGPGKDRKQNRSRSFPEVAAAMAAQWGAL
jgi:hypothetical protein